MNGIKQLSGFLQAAADDARLLPTHVSLYMALFVQWELNGNKNPVIINRNQTMHISKILGRSTYQRCMKQLVTYGYINYKSSFNRFESSLVYLKEQV